MFFLDTRDGVPLRWTPAARPLSSGSVRQERVLHQRRQPPLVGEIRHREREHWSAT